ncbi:MAG: glycosyltransferase family 4 protein [Gemmatimonadales bacterium]|nr:glycosyltransferase family 4 protein [Gemmatimonadales bacterium]
MPPARRPLRIGLCMGLMPKKVGSMEEMIVALARALRVRGHPVRVFVLPPVGDWFAARLDELAVPITLLDLQSEGFADGGALARAECDLLLISLVGPRGHLVRQAARRPSLRLLFLDGASDDGPGPAPSLVRRLFERTFMRRFAGVAGVSDYCTRRDASRWALPARRVRTIHNGVNLERFRVGPVRTSGGPLRLLAVSQLIRAKGLDVALAALAQMRTTDARLALVGDGPERAALEQRADALGVRARVDFLGVRNDVERLLVEADALVHPARWQEAFGYVLAEAMACGRPVVASATGGVPEIVVDGETGFLVPPEDPAALASALDRLTDAALRARLGEAGRARAEALFGLEASTAKLVAWCEEVGASG